jgi:hypothetical protein
MTVVLLHSPLVGPLTWQAVAELMRERGHRVVVPDLSAAMRAGPPHQPALAAAVAAAVRDVPGPLTLVGHSRSGPLLPVLAEAAGEVDALIYVDAHLTYAKGYLPPLPVVGGNLPPWHEWFGPEAIAEILPERAMREAFVAELRPIPLTFYTEQNPVPGTAIPSGYLLFSAPYRDAADQARSRGFPVVELSDHHLAMLTAPAPVAAALDRLIGTVRT